jgi:hypothetical protein
MAEAYRVLVEAGEITPSRCRGDTAVTDAPEPESLSAFHIAILHGIGRTPPEHVASDRAHDPSSRVGIVVFLVVMVPSYHYAAISRPMPTTR